MPEAGPEGAVWTSSGDVQQVGQLVVDVGVVIVAVEHLAACALGQDCHGQTGVAVRGEGDAGLVVDDVGDGDTTVNFTLKRGSAYCFKMTVVNGNNQTPSFTVGNGSVLKTQFVAKVGNDYYYRVYATGTPGQSTGIYTTLPGQNAVKHCTVTIG